MKRLRTMAVGLLRGLATVFVLALPLGMGIFVCEYVYLECCGFWAPDLIKGLLMFLAVKFVVVGYLLLPVGVLLHWIVARTTKVYPRWAWSVIFVGSVLLMFMCFPKGTISGGIALCFLFALSTFRKMGEGVRVFR
jgi:hypothetical protein